MPSATAALADAARTRRRAFRRVLDQLLDDVAPHPADARESRTLHDALNAARDDLAALGETLPADTPSRSVSGGGDAGGCLQPPHATAPSTVHVVETDGFDGLYVFATEEAADLFRHGRRRFLGSDAINHGEAPILDVDAASEMVRELADDEGDPRCGLRVGDRVSDPVSEAAAWKITAFHPDGTAARGDWDPDGRWFPCADLTLLSLADPDAG